jgi:hypothetical protein
MQNTRNDVVILKQTDEEVLVAFKNKDAADGAARKMDEFFDSIAHRQQPFQTCSVPHQSDEATG